MKRPTFTKTEVKLASVSLGMRVPPGDYPVRAERIDRKVYVLGRIFTKSGIQIGTVFGDDFGRAIADKMNEAGT